MISGPIGLTGGIASGKSTVADLFRGWGCLVLDADAISRRALDKGTPCYEATLRAFGPGILLPDGAIDRKAVAKLVFSDESARAALNGIIHPYVRKRLKEETEKALRDSPDRLIVWDVPLLFETGFDSDVTKSVTVSAPQKLRIERIRARDGATRAEALRRIRAQMPDREKVRRADYVIRNTGTLLQLEQRSREVFNELMQTMDR